MKKSTRVIMVFILFILAASIGGYQFYQHSLKPVAQGDAVMVEIPPGSSTKKIASILEQNGLIRNSDIFALHVRFIGIGSKLQAGQYQFTQGQPVDEIIDKLAKGEVFVKTIEFTIPEGLTVGQIADLLAEKGYVQKEKFLDEVNHGVFDYGFVKEIPNDKRIPYRLEGYLFPKTYVLKEGAEEHEIIEAMLKQFKEEWDPAWDSGLKERGLSLHAAVTLASIVEREVVVDQERPRVAGVYFNRLAQDILLQADATVQYALGGQKEIITYNDLELDHPYNTYKEKGLPPGPISSPGRRSIEAVAQPEKHSYLFYVTKKDGSGEHYFSQTYQEHLKNIALSKRSNK